MTSITRIIYDVTEAIANLRKLDRATGKTGKKTKKDFDEGSKGLKQFNDLLGKIHPAAGEAAKTVTNLGSKMGPLAGGIGIVAGAVAGVVAEIVDFQEVLRDARLEADQFIETGNRARDLANLAEELRSSKTFASLEGKSLNARAERSRITQNQQEVAEALETARELVSSRTAAYRDIEKALRDSVNRRKEIERELGDNKAQTAIDKATQGQTAGNAVIRLVDEAERAALKGDTELAKDLTEEARSRAKELGNHVFFTSKIQGAEDQIKAQLEEQRDLLKEQEDSLEKRLKLALEAKKAAEDEVKALNKTQAKLTRDKTNLESVENDIQRAKELDNASTKATTALNTWTQALDNSKRKIATVADPDARTQAGLTADRLKALAPGGKTQVDVLNESRSLTRAAEDLGRLVNFLEKNPEQADTAVDAASQFVRNLQQFRNDLPGGQFSATNEGRATDLLQAVQEFKAAAEAQRDANAAGKGVTGSPQEIRDAVRQGASEAFDRAMGRTISNTPLPNQGANAALPGANQQAAAPVNMNVKIEGGMLDEATMKQIEDRFRRLLREQKSSGIA